MKVGNVTVLTFVQAIYRMFWLLTFSKLRWVRNENSREKKHIHQTLCDGCDDDDDNNDYDGDGDYDDDDNNGYNDDDDDDDNECEND